MRRSLYILLLISLFLGRAGVGFSQTYYRLGDRTIMGTARYVGMGGAMTAIGGDPSAVLDNPAGLGLYRRHEVMLTFDVTFDRTSQLELSNKGKSNIFMVPQASVVLSLPTTNVSDNGVQSHNFMFSYNRVQTFSRVLNAGGEDAPSLGALFASTGVDLRVPYTDELSNRQNGILLQEAGYVNEYALDWAMNIANKWYWGLGLRINSFTFGTDGYYSERFDQVNAADQYFYNANQTSLLYSGAGCSFATGLIYRPNAWLRLGFGLETPSIGSVNISGTGLVETMTDSLRFSPTHTISQRLTDFHMPLHISTSLAIQFDYYALLALQYDYRQQKGCLPAHSIRLGLEVIPVAGLYINAGYAFESAFSHASNIQEIDPTLHCLTAYSQRTRWSQYFSGAVGYRGKSFLLQVGYQYRWQRLDLYAHQNVIDPYQMRTDNHRIIFTIGWHQ